MGNRPLVVNDPTGMVWGYNREQDKYRWFVGDRLTAELEQEGWVAVRVGHQYVSEANRRILLGANGRWVDLGYGGPRLDFQHGLGTEFAEAYARHVVETTVGTVAVAGVVGQAGKLLSAAKAASRVAAVERIVVASGGSIKNAVTQINRAGLSQSDAIQVIVRVVEETGRGVGGVIDVGGARVVVGVVAGPGQPIVHISARGTATFGSADVVFSLDGAGKLVPRLTNIVLP